MSKLQAVIGENLAKIVLEGKHVLDNYPTIVALLAGTFMIAGMLLLLLLQKIF